MKANTLNQTKPDRQDRLNDGHMETRTGIVAGKLVPLLGASLAVCLLAVNSAFAQSAGFWTDVRNLGSGVNGPHDDDNSDLSADGLTLFFESNRPGGLGDDDLYMAYRQKLAEPFANAMRLASVNSASADRAARLSHDGLCLYFLSNRPGGSGNTDIWVAQRSRTTNDLGEPEPFGPPRNMTEINSSQYEAGPFPSSDGLTLYFLRGITQLDIWKATRDRTIDDLGKPVPFANPVALSGAVNSAAHETSPHTTSDGLKLFFSDLANTDPNRPGGLGNGDIWMANRVSTTDDFGNVTNPGPPVNSAWADGHPNIAPNWPADGSILYFDSDRPGGHGGVDMYQATWRAR